MNYEFYQIRSDKSKPDAQGQCKLAFACADWSELYCFIWLDAQQKVTHIQYLFEEKIIEWFKGGRITLSVTNRMIDPVLKRGSKGARTLHQAADSQVYEQAVGYINGSYFPEPYHQMIKSAFASGIGCNLIKVT